MKRIGIYAGSFDPLTYGHVWVAQDALNFCDELYLVIAANPKKKGLFTGEERLALLKEFYKDATDVVPVLHTSGLLTEYAKTIGATISVRGLRAASEFDYEFTMAILNGKLNEGLQTVFIPAREEFLFVSSSSVKELASYGADVSMMVPYNVVSALQNKYPQGST